MPWTINLSTQRRKKKIKKPKSRPKWRLCRQLSCSFLLLVSHFSFPADRPLSPTNCREREGSGVSSFPNWLSGTWSHICYLVGFCREPVIHFFSPKKFVFQLLNSWCVLCSSMLCYIPSDTAVWTNTVWQPAASHSGKHCTAGWKRLPHFLFEDYFKAKNKVSMTQKYKSSGLIARLWTKWYCWTFLCRNVQYILYQSRRN